MRKKNNRIWRNETREVFYTLSTAMDEVRRLQKEFPDHVVRVNTFNAEKDK